MTEQTKTPPDAATKTVELANRALGADSSQKIKPSPVTDPGMPNVLKKLGAMTGIRDTFMVEQSLLRTLGPLVGVRETSLYRADGYGHIVRALHHSLSVATETDGVRRYAERVEEVTNDPGISESVLRLVENVRLLRKSCVIKDANDLLISYPLHGGTELCGYVVFKRDRELTPVEDAIVHGVLEVFANYYALLDTSQRDRLTGLLNRYSLEVNLGRLWTLLSERMNDAEIGGIRREATPQYYWIGVLDIDHFKKINDTYGHVIGDEVLILAARRLETAFRKSDLVYRYGGEEFVAIIAANDVESAFHVFERARKQIESYQFPQVGHITISGGFCGADPVVLPQEVINRADSALYEAKNAGRNRMFHYHTLVEQGVLKEVDTGSIDLF